MAKASPGEIPGKAEVPVGCMGPPVAKGEGGGGDGELYGHQGR